MLISMLIVPLTVNLWTMFQAAQKLGGYETVSVEVTSEREKIVHP